MDLIRLVDFIKESKQAGIYYRNFQRAAHDREFSGVILLAETFKIPAARKGGKSREVNDYAVLNTPEFQAWHKSELLRESLPKTGVKEAPTFEQLVNGTIDLETAAQKTAEFLARKAEQSAKNAERVKRHRVTEKEV